MNVKNLWYTIRQFPWDLTLAVAWPAPVIYFAIEEGRDGNAGNVILWAIVAWVMWVLAVGYVLRWPVTTGVYIVLGFVGPAGVVWLFDRFGETGFEGQSLLDWMNLLIIPSVLAVAAYLFNRRENIIQREIAEKKRDADREIARDKRNEDIVQNYLDKMTDLMRDEDWLVREMKGMAGEEEGEQPALSAKADRLFDIARVRTVSTLRALEGDTTRQASVIHFLREAELLTGKNNPAVLARAIMQNLDLEKADLRDGNLQRADLLGANLQRTSLYISNLEGATLEFTSLQRAVLRDVNLEGATLESANLRGADLWKANLQGATLRGAGLEGADLSFANLEGATLSFANLRGADLWDANLQGATLRGAKFDEETTLPDKTEWSRDVDMKQFTDPEHPEFWEPDWVKEAREKGEGRDE